MNRVNCSPWAIEFHVMSPSQIHFASLCELLNTSNLNKIPSVFLVFIISQIVPQQEVYTHKISLVSIQSRDHVDLIFRRFSLTKF